MKEILERLFHQEALSESEAQELMREVASGQYSDAHVAALLTVFRMRPVTPEELAGFRTALLNLCSKVDLQSSGPLLDLCGTGGDGKSTFNISTLAAFVVAGAGVSVAKHGNYGVSSGCGSSNVLEALGVKFHTDIEKLQQSVNTAGVCFLHAPLFHPAMKNVAPVRKALGVKTIFNLLGPLVNPARPAAQLAGVYSFHLVRLYAHVLQKSEIDFCVVHSLDGYDEFSLTGPVHIATRYGECVFEPEELDLPRLQPQDLHGGDSVAEAVQIFRAVLEGEGTSAQREVVVANAALGLFAADSAGLQLTAESFARYREQASASLTSGAALKVLQQIIKQDG